jgi:hypothetical protein
VARSVKKVFPWPGALAVAALYGASFAVVPADFLRVVRTVNGGDRLGGVLDGACYFAPAVVPAKMSGLEYLAACLPNPLVWVGVGALLAGRRHLPWVVGATALSCALGTWLAWGTRSFRDGFDLWLASMGLLTAVGVWRLRRPSAPGFAADPAVWALGGRGRPGLVDGFKEGKRRLSPGPASPPPC